MTPTIAMYLLGVALIPALGWGLSVIWLLRDIKKSTDELIHMHEHPDDTGFGTGGLKSAIENNTRAVRELCHFIRWLAEKQVDEDPPPFVDEP